MFTWLTDLRSNPSRRNTAPLGLACRLACESLEDRTTPTASSGTFSAITSNFNGTAIPGGDYIWFSSVGKVTGVGSTPVTIHITNQTITFNGTTLNLPDTTLVLTPGATSATASFGSGGWSIATPSKFSGSLFLGGMGWQVPAGGLAGGSVNSITWSGDFTTDTPGVGVQWQWAAAVYTQFSGNESALNVKAVDDNNIGPIKNSDHAGTPESYKPYVIGGARGGGGSNWTGSYTSTVSVTPQVPPPPASVAGVVTAAGQGVQGVLVTLTGTGLTNPVTTTTLADGSYSFAGLTPGTYAVNVTAPSGETVLSNTVGTVNGAIDGASPDAADITTIGLAAGNNGVGYDFTLKGGG